MGAAVQLVVGHGPTRETGPDAACRTRTSLETIEQMLSRLAGGDGPTDRDCHYVEHARSTP